MSFLETALIVALTLYFSSIEIILIDYFISKKEKQRRIWPSPQKKRKAKKKKQTWPPEE